MKLKAGDKVRIRKFNRRPKNWNYEGEMDHLMGQIVEINYITDNYVKVKGQVWSFELSDFEEIALNEPELNVIL
jgi:CRISPR/Cas system-associated protein Cas5 (RAMP superfamily)